MVGSCKQEKRKGRSKALLYFYNNVCTLYTADDAITQTQDFHPFVGGVFVLQKMCVMWWPRIHCCNLWRYVCMDGYFIRWRQKQG